MRDVISDIERWQAQGESIALGTVIQTWGSAPRGVGAKMALTPSGRVAGSVSGGCVEGAVFEAGTETLKTGRPQLLHFGVADETAWEVGLACGGTIEVFVKPLNPAAFDRLRSAFARELPVASVTVLRGPAGLLGRELVVPENGEAFGQLGDGLDAEAVRIARSALERGSSERVPLRSTQRAEPVELFVDVMLPAPTLVIVGGVHIAIALTAIAKALGYRTIIVDPRKTFGSQERFPHADRLIQAWPDEALAEVGLTRSTAVAMLTHDPKLDDPGLMAALNSPAFYVGALGSQTTQAKRRARLLAEGLTEAQLARLRAPIGLDIGARTPEEIALSVMAQIIAVRNGHEDGGLPKPNQGKD